jgi:hypothetical protein
MSRGPHAPGHDPMLTQLGVSHALRALAELVDGRTDPQAQMEWAINLGFLAPKPGERDVLCLTERGAAIVYAFWKAYQEGRHQSRTVYLPHLNGGGDDA